MTETSTLSRRDEILKTATRLFHREGYANVGMRYLAEEVNLRPASLYHHFGSKEAILYALAVRVNEEWIKHARALLYGDPDPRIAIKRLMRDGIVFCWENREAFEVSYREIRELNPEHMSELVFYRRSYRNMVQKHIERGVATGHIHVENVNLATLAVINVQNGVNTWFRDPVDQHDGTYSPLSIEQVAEYLAELIADHILI